MSDFKPSCRSEASQQDKCRHPSYLLALFFLCEDLMLSLLLLFLLCSEHQFPWVHFHHRSHENQLYRCASSVIDIFIKSLRIVPQLQIFVFKSFPLPLFQVSGAVGRMSPEQTFLHLSCKQKLPIRCRNSLHHLHFPLSCFYLAWLWCDFFYVWSSVSSNHQEEFLKIYP